MDLSMRPPHAAVLLLGLRLGLVDPPPCHAPIQAAKSCSFVNCLVTKCGACDQCFNSEKPHYYRKCWLPVPNHRIDSFAMRRPLTKSTALSR